MTNENQELNKSRSHQTDPPSKIWAALNKDRAAGEAGEKPPHADPNLTEEEIEWREYIEKMVLITADRIWELIHYDDSELVLKWPTMSGYEISRYLIDDELYKQRFAAVDMPASVKERLEALREPETVPEEVLRFLYVLGWVGVVLVFLFVAWHMYKS